MRFSLQCRLDIYATPVARIKVTGTKPSDYTWTVDSPVKEQQEHNRFIEDSHVIYGTNINVCLSKKEVCVQLQKPNERHFEQRVIVYLL